MIIIIFGWYGPCVYPLLRPALLKIAYWYFEIFFAKYLNIIIAVEFCENAKINSVFNCIRVWALVKTYKCECFHVLVCFLIVELCHKKILRKTIHPKILGHHRHWLWSYKVSVFNMLLNWPSSVKFGESLVHNLITTYLIWLFVPLYIYRYDKLSWCEFNRFCLF